MTSRNCSPRRGLRPETPPRPESGRGRCRRRRPDRSAGRAACSSRHSRPQTTFRSEPRAVDRRPLPAAVAPRAASTPSRSAAMAVLTSPPASSSARSALDASSAGRRPHQAHRALAQLVVGRLHVDHQVAVHLAQPDHQRRAERVEHQLLGGAGSSCASNPAIGSGPVSTTMHTSTSRTSADAVHTPGRSVGAPLARALRARQHPRRSAAGGRPKARSLTPRSSAASGAGRRRLQRLRRPVERAGATGDARQVASRRHAEGRCELGRVQRRQAAGRCRRRRARCARPSCHRSQREVDRARDALAAPCAPLPRPAGPRR